MVCPVRDHLDALAALVVLLDPVTLVACSCSVTHTLGKTILSVTLRDGGGANGSLGLRL